MAARKAKVPAAQPQSPVTQQAQPVAPPAVSAPGSAPVRSIDSQALQQLGYSLKTRFDSYVSDRLLSEQKWLRNLRQYLGIYDPDIEQQLAPNQSRAYPRITRVKCISMLARIMNLMFPGNERNWELNAKPSVDMNPNDIKQAVMELQKAQQPPAQPGQPPAPLPPITDEFINLAVQKLADKRANDLSTLIDDQMQEIGGDQTLDYISLVRQVVFSGVRYGLGVLEGPYVRTENRMSWGRGSAPGTFVPKKVTIRKPQFEFVPVWDYYPDMSAKTLAQGEGYFIRKIMGRSQIRKLANRDDFFADQIKNFLKSNTTGNYQAKSFETELRVMGTRAQVNDQKRVPHGRYEVIIWKGPVSAETLVQLGCQVPDNKRADDIEAEVWMIDNTIIKADINPWRKLGVDGIKTIHTFVFDEDDTAPVGNGLPNVMRDSQMSVCATARMALDNGSVVCGPNIEVNTALLRSGQDVNSVYAYKVWERDDEGPTQQFPAVREIKFDAHLEELAKLMQLFMQFADMETFIGPATGGDMDKMPSEPMRTAAGQSMMKGDAALPFKDIVRNFDFFTQSVILSLVWFNRKFNPQIVKEADFDVVARGATSLVAKEVRGIQTDLLAQTLTPDDRDWIDEEQFIKQRLATRDMAGIMVDQQTAMQNRQQRTAFQAQVGQAQLEAQVADTKKTTADAYKAITQGQKNSAGADATTSKAALDIVGHAINGDEGTEGTAQQAA